jgi:hypothetical protein
MRKWERKYVKKVKEQGRGEGRKKGGGAREGRKGRSKRLRET